jgi:very-short-patch-repair endonuclease
MGLRLSEAEAKKLGVQLDSNKSVKPKRVNGMSLRSAAGKAAGSPQDKLQLACKNKWGERCEIEYKCDIPGRKFRLDVAFPDAKLCVELDGWEWHGKHKSDFHRDRERQNLLTLNGWRILRFTAKQVNNNATFYEVLEQIQTALSL